jgi:hypothetical protein
METCSPLKEVVRFRCLLRCLFSEDVPTGQASTSSPGILQWLSDRLVLLEVWTTRAKGAGPQAIRANVRVARLSLAKNQNRTFSEEAQCRIIA